MSVPLTSIMDKVLDVLPLIHHDRDGSVVIHLAKVRFTGLRRALATIKYSPFATRVDRLRSSLVASSRFEPETIRTFARQGL